MSRAIAKHFAQLKEQEQILIDWQAYEYDLNKYWKEVQCVPHPISSCFNFINEEFEAYIATMHHNLARSKKRLKIAASLGGVVDITGTPLAHDMMLVSDPRSATALMGNKQRVRDNIARVDFYERFGRMVDITAGKLTIQQSSKPDNAMTPQELSYEFLNPTFQPVVLLSFDDPADAMLYRLAVQ